ncbi:hypothetical protein [Mycoplasma todarodis]|uniref:Uncharacterized protein n=1 Tax=Mycoplasma todarodis TaxID=1937191 RepID=A0A4V6N9L1_9MOLU|nr:hypothetical protein [Mycoplasma todarodis]TCG12096.1 hypothetical protein C4B25_00175 [Mycoplasma todarodis]
MIFKIIEFIESEGETKIYRGIDDNGRLANRIINCPDLIIGEKIRVKRLLSTNPGVSEMEYSFSEKMNFK